MKDTYKIKELLNIINLKKFTYFYETKTIKLDKYDSIRKIIKEIFIDNYEFYIKIHIKNRKTILGRNNLPILKGFSTEYKANINEEPFTDNININNVF